ncbi:MAG: Smr/MutS family protein [Clostridia bacterium]|nr:Smr/MutS family protein [Clostridia bacterium]
MKITSGMIDVDIHGKTKRAAYAIVKNIVSSAGADVYRVRVIHGCTAGTELRDMIRSDFKKHPKVKRIATGLNPGETFLVLREL